MVWRSLPGTVIPDYEESTNHVLLRNQEFFISVFIKKFRDRGTNNENKKYNRILWFK